MDRALAAFLVLCVAAAAGLAPSTWSAGGMLLAAVGLLAALHAVGMALFRLLALPVDAPGAALPVGLAVLVAASSGVAGLGLGVAAQGVAAAGLVGGAPVLLLLAGGREAGAGRPWGWLLLAVVAAALVAAWGPLARHGAWTVAGHDLDTLQHQDGALHTTITILVGEGVRPSPGYPLGLHAFTAMVAGAAGLDAFRSFAVVMLVLPAVAGAAATWMGAALGLSAGWAALAGLLVGLHPLLLFAQMEQFGPQLAASALVPAVVAAGWGLWRSGGAGPVVVASVLLAAVVSAYGLAAAVVGPLFALAAWGRPFRVTVVRWVAVAALAAALAPVGVARLAHRLGGSREVPPSPVKTATRPEARAPDPAALGWPDAGALLLEREGAKTLKWGVSVAHLLGVAPYRDHFVRTARMAESYLGRPRFEVVRPLFWVLVSVAVPAATLVAGLLVLLAALAWAGRRAWREVAVLGGGLLACGAALWLGSGSGIKPYYGFKVATLAAGVVGVAVVAGAAWLATRWGGRWGVALGLALLLSRLPATGAVEVEYARAVALDRGFVTLLEPARLASRGLRARAQDPSPTRRYWASRLVFARAKEVSRPEEADILLCADGEPCPLAQEGRLLARAGRHGLWLRR
jgi:hypothetical protein